jgi:YHS domain-containing protein
MKKIVYIMLSLLILSSCKKEEVKKEMKEEKEVGFEKPSNPLNDLKYDNKIDFYCNMDITKYGVSDTVAYKGKLYGFCSKMCKDEFVKTPEKYLAKK